MIECMFIKKELWCLVQYARAATCTCLGIYEGSWVYLLDSFAESSQNSANAKRN